MARRIPIEVIQALPKAELHQHLDGSVRPLTVLQLSREQNITLRNMKGEVIDDVEALEKAISCKKKEVNSLVDYLEGFPIVLSVMQQPYALTRCTYEVCQDAHRSGVRLLEIRFSPLLHTSQEMGLSTVLNAVVEGRVRGLIPLRNPHFLTFTFSTLPTCTAFLPYRFTPL